jgi:hypothetical protein
VHNYRGPGIYRHYKGGLYEIAGLALWEPMAGKDDSDVKLSDELVEFSNDFAATDWDMVSSQEIERIRAMLLRAAELLGEPLLVIYEPLTTGSLLEGLPGVKFWARGKADFDSDVKVPGVRDTHPDTTIARFIFKTGVRDGEIK